MDHLNRLEMAATIRSTCPRCCARWPRKARAPTALSMERPSSTCRGPSSRDVRQDILWHAQPAVGRDARRLCGECSVLAAAPSFRGPGDQVRTVWQRRPRRPWRTRPSGQRQPRRSAGGASMHAKGGVRIACRCAWACQCAEVRRLRSARLALASEQRASTRVSGGGSLSLCAHTEPMTKLAIARRSVDLIASSDEDCPSRYGDGAPFLPYDDGYLSAGSVAARTTVRRVRSADAAASSAMAVTMIRRR